MNEYVHVWYALCIFFCQGRHLSLQKKLSFKNQNVRISKIIESSSHTPF